MRYLVTIGGRIVEVDLRGPHPTVDGVEVAAELRTVPGTRLRQLVVDGRTHTLLARRQEEMGRWAIVLNGQPLEAEALDERTRTIQEMAGGAEAATEMVIKAPMPGLVVRLNVQVGDRVAAGQGIIVIEAMKMENELKASGEGTVARIEVEPGQPVDKGATLIVLE